MPVLLWNITVQKSKAMKVNDFKTAPGHWILARMGKKVLRPGGSELTIKLVDAMNFNHSDEVVEFAPGLGFTAGLILNGHPKTYTGIDADSEAVELLNKNITGENITFITSNAATTPLPNDLRDKVIGEAMLTMQADARKSDIIKEAYRILKKGGLYGIHELGLRDVEGENKDQIKKDLASSIKINARPLTEQEWKTILEKEGFTVKKVYTNHMYLLEPQRIIEDEGLARSVKIGWNILTHPEARKRIAEMRKVFRRHQQYINAISIVAEKN